MKLLSCVQLFVTPWTVAYQAPPSKGFSRPEYCSGLPLEAECKMFNELSTINNLVWCLKQYIKPGTGTFLRLGNPYFFLHDSLILSVHIVLRGHALLQITLYMYCCQVASVVSDSVRSHRRKPTRLPRPWDSPGKSTGVGCHFLLQCMKVKSESEVAQLCPTLSDPMDCAFQAPPSVGFSRQEYWSGVPLPSPLHVLGENSTNDHPCAKKVWWSPNFLH